MILIVDDKQENLFSLRTILEQHGFATDAALSGEEALKKLLRNEYALIILDVQMPVMDGFEVAEAITGLNKTKDIPIIFLSAVNTHKKFIAKGFESGAVEYLAKPVDPDILILKVRNFYRLYEKTYALKETEKALTATVSQLNITLETLPQMAFTTDRDGNINYANNKWLEYASSLNSFPETNEGKSLQHFWQHSINSGKAVEAEVCIKKPQDDHSYYHLLKARPVIVNGLISGWVGTLTNIHEQKMLNETLEKKVAERTRELLEINRDLEITNSELQQFTSVASHDLKEPLRKIQFFGNMIKDRAQLEDTMAVYLNKILQSSARMHNLITDLLSFASISHPQLFQVVDIRHIIEDILIDLELSIDEKKAVIEIGEIPPLEVIPSLIRQLFQNLISNALKFTKEGVVPTIRINAEPVDVPSVDSSKKENGAFCRISIVDNGIGFDERYLDKIFTIFQRLNARAEYEGTGIGLAIAKKIMDRHNGIITAKSKTGEGSTFYLLFPVKQDELHKSKEEGQLLRGHPNHI